MNKLHLGCGDVYLNGWINIDLDSPAADMRLDLAQSLPFTEGYASHIFSEHFIEHITRDQAVSFLKECRRILIPGGTIRVSTPNLRFLIAAYLAHNIGEWEELWRPETRCSMINDGMRAWGHQFLYDAEELVRIFKEAGFGSIIFQHYRQSRLPEFAGLESRPFHHELIVDATNSDDGPLVDFSALRADEQIWFNQFTSLEASEHTIANQLSHISDIKSKLNARAIQIIELEKTITDQVSRIRSIESELSARDFHILELGRTVHEMRSSIGWRMTAPLRYFARLINSNK